MMTQALVDTTIIEAPSSPNKEQQHNPEIHRTRKGNPWHLA